MIVSCVVLLSSEDDDMYNDQRGMKGEKYEDKGVVDEDGLRKIIASDDEEEEEEQKDEDKKKEEEGEGDNKEGEEKKSKNKEGKFPCWKPSSFQLSRKDT